jgi:hypothetical protein
MAPVGREAIVGALLLLLSYSLFVLRFGESPVPAAALALLGLPVLGGGLAVAAGRTRSPAP